MWPWTPRLSRSREYCRFRKDVSHVHLFCCLLGAMKSNVLVEPPSQAVGRRNKAVCDSLPERNARWMVTVGRVRLGGGVICVAASPYRARGRAVVCLPVRVIGSVCGSHKTTGGSYPHLIVALFPISRGFESARFLAYGTKRGRLARGSGRPESGKTMVAKSPGFCRSIYGFACESVRCR